MFAQCVFSFVRELVYFSERGLSRLFFLMVFIVVLSILLSSIAPVKNGNILASPVISLLFKSSEKCVPVQKCSLIVFLKLVFRYLWLNPNCFDSLAIRAAMQLS